MVGERTGIGRGLIGDPHHGPLPVMLLTLTTVTGIVDAVSILSLGRVFVANMTGNVVFIGFALTGAPGFSLAASLAALLGFLIGAVGGGLAVNRLGPDRALLFRNAVVVEFLLFLIAVAALAAAGQPLSGSVRDLVAGVVAVALGLQNAVVRKLAVPDLTTTVLTMTLTGIAADLRAGPAVVTRRILAVATMLLGAVVGALITLHVNPATAMGLAAVLMGLVAVGAMTTSRRQGQWRFTAAGATAKRG